MKHRLRLHISYDGTDFFGWQKQPDKSSVQESLEKSILRLTGDICPTTGSGRTDAGVHALNQVVHFDTTKNLDKYDWTRGLNRYLPDSIRVREVFKAPETFHSLRDSLEKTYLYQIQDGLTEDPRLTRYAHWVSTKINLDYMNRLSESFLGNKDFASYMTQGTPVKSTVRELTQLHWSRSKETPDLVQVKFTGNGFLKQMVRNLMGSLLHQYWEQSLSPEELKSILEAKDRKKAHGTAPASGLCLLEVKYPPELDKNCLKL